VTDEFPKIRNLEAFPYSEGGHSLVMLRDPSHMAERILVVTREVYSVLPLFNGRNSLLDIQAELTRKQGEIVFRERIADLLHQLDKAHFLDNENFREHRKAVIERYHLRKTRPAFHANVSYPEEDTALLEQINDMYVGEDGAGLPGPVTDRRIRALVAPHIDLRMGGQVYTHAYRALAESDPPDLFVIIGTCHSGLPCLFSLSGKDFETPLGISRLDQEFYEALRREFASSQYDKDLAHRSEHTIEFQLLFLQHLYRTTEVKILPVLASFSYEEFASPERKKLFWDFIETLKATEQLSGKRVCYIASVDLAHMGPRYGDSFQPDRSFIDDTSKKDLEMLEYVTSNDPQGFFEYLSRERDRRRICGFPAIYTILNLIGETEGRLLRHSHCTMDDTGSFVTYASLAFYDRDRGTSKDPKI